MPLNKSWLYFSDLSKKTKTLFVEKNSNCHCLQVHVPCLIARRLKELSFVTEQNLLQNGQHCNAAYCRRKVLNPPNHVRISCSQCTMHVALGKVHRFYAKKIDWYKQGMLWDHVGNTTWMMHEIKTWSAIGEVLVIFWIFLESFQILDGLWQQNLVLVFIMERINPNLHILKLGQGWSAGVKTTSFF